MLHIMYSSDNNNTSDIHDTAKLLQFKNNSVLTSLAKYCVLMHFVLSKFVNCHLCCNCNDSE